MSRVAITKGATAGFKPWTVREDNALRAAYLAGGYKAAVRALPGRTAGSIFHRAQRKGLLVRRRWTRADDERLRTLWDLGVAIAWVARELGRTQATTYWRAQKLGLPLGCPDGFEYLSVAADRTGYDASQLRRVLRWAGVPIRVSLGRPTQAGRRFHIVDPLDVDDAIAAWHETETLHSAAQRFGVADETMRRWLAAIGVDDNGREFRTHWRIKSVDVDRAVAARRAS